MNNTDWISVKDRLPEFATSVLICTKLKYITVAAYGRGMWFRVSDWRVLDDVNFWQPLPETPISEEE